MHGFVIIKALVQNHQDSLVFLADDLAGPEGFRCSPDELISFGQVVVSETSHLLFVRCIEYIDAAVVHRAGPFFLVKEGAQEGKNRAIDTDIAGELQPQGLIAADHGLCVLHEGNRSQDAVRIIGNNAGNAALDGFFYKCFQAGGVKAVGLVNENTGVLRKVMSPADILG